MECRDLYIFSVCPALSSLLTISFCYLPTLRQIIPGIRYLATCGYLRCMGNVSAPTSESNDIPTMDAIANVHAACLCGVGCVCCCCPCP